MEALAPFFVALVGLIAVGVLFVGYVVWRSNRRMEDAVAEIGEQAARGDSLASAK